jgi:hypothetical protein
MRKTGWAIGPFKMLRSGRERGIGKTKGWRGGEKF